ncbi:MAG: hypothetical protein AAFQ53_15760 [Bacteroidota bacterium]
MTFAIDYSRVWEFFGWGLGSGFALAWLLFLLGIQSGIGFRWFERGFDRG